MIQKHKIVAAESVVDTYTDEDIYTMVAGGGERNDVESLV